MNSVPLLPIVLPSLGQFSPRKPAWASVAAGLELRRKPFLAPQRNKHSTTLHDDDDLFGAPMLQAHPIDLHQRNDAPFAHRSTV